MLKRFSMLSCVIIFASNIYAFEENIFYISPGFCISWNLKGEMILSPKLSLGIYEKGTFYNITLGYSSSEDVKLFPYYFIEGQIGRLSNTMEFRKIQLLTGLGMGIGIHKGKGDPVSYRTSLFSGYMVFAKASFVYKEKIHPDLGLETVLPIPLNGSVLGSPGG